MARLLQADMLVEFKHQLTLNNTRRIDRNNTFRRIISMLSGLSACTEHE